jgi:penicillin amidase
VDDEYPYEIGRSFYPYRAGRLTEIIEQQIESKQPFTVQLMKEMQVDFLNTEARALLPMLLDAVDQTQSIPSSGSLEQKVLQLMEDWDFVEGHDSAAAIVWYHWYNHITEALFTELLGFHYANPIVISRVIQDAYSHSSQIVFSELDEKHQLMLDQVARETLTQAIESTVQLQGKNPDRWEWGKFHSLTIKHPLGAVKPLNLLFDVGNWELGGSGATPGALGYNRKKEEFSHGAGWRFAGDLASLDSFYDIVIPGQSGQLSSPYYSESGGYLGSG